MIYFPSITAILNYRKENNFIIAYVTAHVDAIGNNRISSSSSLHVYHVLTFQCAPSFLSLPLPTPTLISIPQQDVAIYAKHIYKCFFRYIFTVLFCPVYLCRYILSDIFVRVFVIPFVLCVYVVGCVLYGIFCSLRIILSAFILSGYILSGDACQQPPFISSISCSPSTCCLPSSLSYTRPKRRTS